MKIVINARLTSGFNTGIAHYINSLYANWPNKENLIFLKPKIFKIQGFLKTFWFDNFVAGFLARGEIFHGPANILPINKKQEIKYAVTVHDMAFLTVPESCSFIFRLYYQWAVRRSVEQADLVIAVSKSTKRDLQKFYKTPENKIKVIYSGVDEIFFQHQKKTPIFKGKYIFTVATHIKRKNLYIIFNLLIKEQALKDFKLVISGPLTEIQIPEQLTGRVFCTGFVSQEKLVNLYSHARFFIYPSYYEGFGFPVLEAMACRCPVLVSDTSSLREIVPDKYFRFNPNNLPEVINKARYLLSLSQKHKINMLNKNYFWAKKFRWQKTVKETLTAFQNISQ